MIPAAAAKLVRRWRIQREITKADFARRPPLVVFQPGNVGSSTVYETLRLSFLPHPVHHVHYLSKEGIRAAVRFHKTLPDPSIPDEIRLGEALRRKMKSGRQDPWRIITLTRDPVERAVSAFFHNARTHAPEILDGGRVDEDKALSRLMEAFEGRGRENPGYSWFAQEFKPALGVDPLGHPFDPQQGWSVIQNGRMRVLILRFENLKAAFHTAAAALLDLPGPLEAPWVPANLSAEKDYHGVQQRVKARLALPKALVERIYSDPYVRHFYSGEDIRAFMKKWSAFCGG